MTARPRSRAPAVVVAGAAALALAVGLGPAAPAAPSAPRVVHCHRNAPPLIHDGFPEPRRRFSRHGILRTTLDAARGPVRLGGERVVARTYDGQFPGPALVVCRGDRLVVALRNHTRTPTNLHLHGFHISPRGIGDNPFRNVRPGHSARSVFDIPRDNPPGAYWYHPHRHMYVESQIYAGMAGPIVEEGGLDRLPGLRHIPQRWLFLQAPLVRDGRLVPVLRAGFDQPLYVNGALHPTARIHPGQLQRWRLFNGASDRMIVLRLGGRPFRVLAEDGDTLPRMRTTRTLRLSPGSRREVLVRGGPHGRVRLTARPFREYAGPSPTPVQTVATLRSAGRRVHDRLPAARLSHPVDLRGERVDRRRRIVFATPAPGETHWTMNGAVFDPHVVNVTMKLGALEQWRLVNTASEWHTFHIHVDDFQVVVHNGRRVRTIVRQDNVSLAPHSSTVIRIRPTDFTGRSVFHCHITFHEDHGMMAVVRIVRRPSAAQAAAGVQAQPGLAVASAALGASGPPPPIPAAASLRLVCRALGRRA